MRRRDRRGKRAREGLTDAVKNVSSCGSDSDGGHSDAAQAANLGSSVAEALGCGAISVPPLDQAAVGEVQMPGAEDRIQPIVRDPVSIQELRALPLVRSRQPMLSLPRALKDRTGAICCGLLQDAVQFADAANESLLLFHSAQLLLRVPKAEKESSDMQEALARSQDAGDMLNGGPCRRKTRGIAKCGQCGP